MASTGQTAADSYSADLLEVYQRQGLVKFPLPETIVRLREDLRSELVSWLRHFVPDAKIGCSTLSNDLADLAQSDRRLIGILYKVARRFPAVKQIASHEGLLSLAGSVMRTKMVSCCNFVSLRIDLPGEEKYLVQPHQDFPYIQGSLNGVTMWIPLEDCPLELGPPSWLPASHLWGVLPVREYSLAEAGQVGANIFELRDPQSLPNADYVQTEVSGGEALLFHTLLVHRSEPNRSRQARISLQIRFDDLLDEDSFRRDYPEGRYLDNHLRSSYPEFCSQEERDSS